MSQNRLKYSGIMGQIKQRERRQDNHEYGFFKGRHRVVLLDNKELLVSLVGSSSVAFTDKDVRTLSGGGASSVSANAIAAIVQLVLSDTGSAATATLLQVRKNGSTDDPGHVLTRAAHINSTQGYAQGICGIDESFLLEYKLTASGANTATASIYLIGYIEQLK